MKTLRTVLLNSGKAMLAIVLGIFALVIASVLIGFINGVFTGIFGWPTLTSGMRNLLLLSLFIIALVIHRNHRKHRHSTPLPTRRPPTHF